MTYSGTKAGFAYVHPKIVENSDDLACASEFLCSGFWLLLTLRLGESCNSSLVLVTSTGLHGDIEIEEIDLMPLGR